MPDSKATLGSTEIEILLWRLVMLKFFVLLVSIVSSSVPLEWFPRCP